MTNSQIRTIEDFVQFQNALSNYRVVQLGFRLGILRCLELGQQTSEHIASLLKMDPWLAELVCTALSHTKLLEKYGDDYALSSLARLLINDPIGQEAQESGEDSGADGGVPKTKQVGINDHLWTRTPAALDAAEALDIGRTRRGFRILELGGGAAVFSTSLAHRDPDCQVTVVESPENLKRCQETVESVGITNQFEYISGDPWNPEIGEHGFDLILAVGMLHHRDGPAVLHWLSQVVRNLKTDGELALIDYFHGQEKGMRTLAFLELEMTLRFPQWRMHSPPVVRSWLLQAGLSNIQFAFLPSVPHVWGLLLGQKQRPS